MFFSSSTPSLPADAQRAVRDYERRIAELLESCADHQRHDPEVFLWNARRALEAMCHLLLTVKRKRPSRVDKPTNETSLDGMIKQLKSEGVLDREQHPRFELARAHTNLGVHIQQPNREDYAAPVRDTAHVLPELLEWLYTGSIAAPYLGGRDDLPIDVIRDGGREGPSLKDAAAVARTEQRAAELTANLLRAELDEKERALRTRETRWWTWLKRVAYGSTVGFVIGLCAGSTGTTLLPEGLSSALARVSSAPEPPVVVPAAPSATPPPPTDPPATPPSPAPIVAAALVEAAPAPVAAPVEAIASPAVALACPSGMVLVPAISGMRLGQPLGGRKNWPRPDARTLDPVDVPAFCLDARPRHRTSVDPALFDTEAAAGCERHLDAAKRPRERTCLSRDEAEAACAQALPGGHLPGILEWESAARSGVEALMLPVHEWVGERFPPAVFRRFDPSWSNGDGMWVGRIKEGREPESPDGAVLLGWNQQPPDVRHVERTFRCAVGS